MVSMTESTRIENQGKEESGNLTSTHDDDRSVHGSSVIVPSDFICPITLEQMKFPMITRYGHSYERDAIVEWIYEGNGFCPMTRHPLKLFDIVANHTLQEKIQSWQRENNIDLSESSRDTCHKLNKFDCSPGGHNNSWHHKSDWENRRNSVILTSYLGRIRAFVELMDNAENKYNEIVSS
jgi:hypothetical protein